MKKIYYLFFLSFFFAKFQAQVYYPFPSDSAEWHIKLTCQAPFCTAQIYSPYQTHQNSDTTINGKVYHKMYDIPSNTLYSFYRESSKKIYVKYPLGGPFGNDTAEFVLYNFNLNIGDTFIVKVPSSWIGGIFPTQPKIVLTSTNTANNVWPWQTLPNANSTKVYYFSSNVICTSANLLWAEGVGNYSGFFYNMHFPAWASCLSPPAPNNIFLTCFIKNGTVIYGGGCITNTDNTSKETESLNIYPNPNSGQVKISVSSNSQNIKSILIKDVLGKEIKIISNLNNQDYYLDIKSLDNGIYIMIVNFENGSINKRLIKN